MNYLQNWLRKSSLKVKWSLGASAAIFFTFFIFSFIQYHIISRVMLHEENNNVRQVLDELAIFFQQRGGVITQDAFKDNMELANQIIEKDQTIRVLDHYGNQITISTDEEKAIKSLYYIPFQPVQKKTVDLLETNQEKIYVGRAPIHSREFTGYVEVIQPLTRYRHTMSSLFLMMTIFGAIALVMSGLFGFLMAKNFLKPLQKLSATMKKIRRKGFHERMEPSNSKDEMGELTNIFNGMMDQIELSFNQQRQFVEDASHELRTPVQIMEGHLKLLNRWGKNDPNILDESLHASIQELERMKNLVQELLDLSRAEQVESKISDQITLLLKTLNQVIKNFELIHEDFEFQLHYKGLKNTTVHIGENHLEQIMIILLDNAVKFSDQIKKVDIFITEENDCTKVTVKDYGVGIPNEDLSNIFHRFYRVDKARSRVKGGNGLGLAIAKQLIESYSGEINASSNLGEGTSITLTLPSMCENR